jgi:hypothetical protein
MENFRERWIQIGFDMGEIDLRIESLSVKDEKRADVNRSRVPVCENASKHDPAREVAYPFDYSCESHFYEGSRFARNVTPRVGISSRVIKTVGDFPGGVMLGV